MKAILAIAFFCLAVASATPVRDTHDGVYLPLGMKKLYPYNATLLINDMQVYADASVKDCGGDGTIKLHSLKLPSKITMPGSVYVNVDLEFKKELDNVAIDIKLEKKVGFWVPVPCVNNIGSCFYSDICKMINEAEDDSILQQFIDAGLEVCPFPAKRYTIEKSIDLPEFPSE